MLNSLITLMTHSMAHSVVHSADMTAVAGHAPQTAFAALLCAALISFFG